MPDSAEFKSSLIKPALVFAALILLFAAFSIGVNHWSFAHGQPHWAKNLLASNFYVNIALVVGWFAYVQMRRRKASGQQ
jgi:hypothetical protein